MINFNNYKTNHKCEIILDKDVIYFNLYWDNIICFVHFGFRNVLFINKMSISKLVITYTHQCASTVSSFHFVKIEFLLTIFSKIYLYEFYWLSQCWNKAKFYFKEKYLVFSINCSTVLKFIIFFLILLGWQASVHTHTHSPPDGKYLPYLKI